MKNVCSVKDMTKRIRQVTHCVKTSEEDISDKEWLAKIYKEILKLNNKKYYPIKKWTRYLNRHFRYIGVK